MAISRAGRPRSSSLEVLTEAACELFLEQGYESTSVNDIARRAGVSRSSFFNYASSKSGLLWDGFDAQLTQLPLALADNKPADALLTVFGDLEPDSLALAIANAEAMAITVELERESAIRHARIAAAVSERLARTDPQPMSAEIRASAYAGAVLAALRHWSFAGPGKQTLGSVLGPALSLATRAVQR